MWQRQLHLLRWYMSPGTNIRSRLSASRSSRRVSLSVGSPSEVISVWMKEWTNEWWNELINLHNWLRSKSRLRLKRRIRRCQGTPFLSGCEPQREVPPPPSTLYTPKCCSLEPDEALKIHQLRQSTAFPPLELIYTYRIEVRLSSPGTWELAGNWKCSRLPSWDPRWNWSPCNNTIKSFTRYQSKHHKDGSYVFMSQSAALKLQLFTISSCVTIILCLSLDVFFDINIAR